MHILTLSFDDGFEYSSIRTASIFETFGLAACFNVPATPCFEHQGKKGDFPLWNELRHRGHEIMPHGYKHTNKSLIPFHQAKDLILRCLDVFSENLDGFTPQDAVFHFPLNRATPRLESWLPDIVRVYRVGGTGFNPLPGEHPVRLTCTTNGPDNCEAHLQKSIGRLLQSPTGWLIYNTHGLDHEGWGPIRASCLEDLLESLLTRTDVHIIPAGRCLAACA